MRTGSRLASARRRLHLSRGFAVGANVWYLLPNGAGHGVLKVRHGIVQEVGVAASAFTRTRAQEGVFFSSFS